MKTYWALLSVLLLTLAETPPVSTTENSSTLADYIVYAVNRIKFEDPPPPDPDDFDIYSYQDSSSSSSSSSEVEYGDTEPEHDHDVDPPRPAPYLKYDQWIEGWPRHPLYVIILAGFRWDILDLIRDKPLSSFKYLRNNGVTVPHVVPVFPPEDYPVWTSIATGMHPEEHDVTGDLIFDIKERRFFNSSDPGSVQDAQWWQAVEPFWSIAAKHGRKVALYNWHNCNLHQGTTASPDRIVDCRPYTATPTGAATTSKSPNPVPPKRHILRQFDEAFTRIHKEKYDVSVVYTDMIRRVVEKHGLMSPQTHRALTVIDDILQAKLTDIKTKKEIAALKMNVMVISDYGISSLEDMEEVVLEEYLDPSHFQNIVYSTGYAAVTPYALAHEAILLEAAQMPGVDVYLTSQVQSPPIWHSVQVPDSLYYGEGKWAPDILMVAKPGFRLVSRDPGDKIISASRLPDGELKAGAGRNPYSEPVKYPKAKKGQRMTEVQNATIKAYHSYEKYKWDMNTQAFLMGPDFKRNYISESKVEAVDFYQLFCFLLQIPNGHHSGDWSRVKDLMIISGGVQPNPATALTLVTSFGVLALTQMWL